ncbi:MAG: type II toxin-antitoxin system VapB family antitoxin [Proteobacteria bacterium]|nr:type II toxin-antitoxin system VapB family antitoxin [Pseudomonadota bacterium]MDA1057851.1 type II toxin-antitoxin system VapB family antitoxin [Pseudomonadota bacterium]
MSLNIKDEETDRLARELAARSGKSITRAVKDALRAALTSGQPDRSKNRDDMLAAITRLQDRIAAMPRRTDKSVQEIMDEMYDEQGLPR